MSLAREARLFLRSSRSGILSTHSSKFDGYPFGSVAPFVLDHDGQPIILISTIAEHTKNIIANPKVSLLVFAGDEDLQANSRLTLIGDATIIEKNDPDLRARYLRYLPQAASYFDMHDFSFYRIAIKQARYIAGFGKMSWIPAQEFTGTELTDNLATGVSGKLAGQEQGIVDHMNADHSDSLRAYCLHVHNINPVTATMLGLDSDGFDVSAITADDKNHILRFNFEAPVSDALSARTALVALSKAAKP